MNQKKLIEKILEEDLVLPTPERFKKGDVNVTDKGVYCSEFPTALERWREKGFLGSGEDEELRFEACAILLELGEHTKLMASCTVDYGKIPGSAPGGEPDIQPLDHVRFILRECTNEASKLFFDLINCPTYSNPFLTADFIADSMDELVEAVEKWKESELFLQ